METEKEIVLIVSSYSDAMYDNIQVEITDEIKSLLPLVQKICDALKQRTKGVGINWNTDEGEKAPEHPYNLYNGILTKQEIDLFKEKFMSGARPTLMITDISIQKIKENILFSYRG